MMNSSIITTPYYRGLPIQASESLSCRKDILDAIYDIFARTVFRRRTLFMRFDVTFPKEKQYPPDNSVFVGFIANFMKNRSRNGYKPEVLWVRERNHKERNHHYHCILCLSGRTTHKIYGHLEKAEELWERALKLELGEGAGLIDYCNREDHGIMVEPGDMQATNKCFYWASYLSKTRTKEYLHGIRTVGRSQS